MQSNDDELRQYFDTIELSAPLCTASEERAFLDTIHLECDGENHIDCHNCHARRIFVERNMRLVLHVVRKTMSLKDPRVMDVVSAGTLGLIRGIDLFNVSACDSTGRPYRFSTYGVWWIRSFVMDELKAHEKRVIRHPSYHDQFKKAKNHLIELRNDPEIETFAVITYLKAEHGWSEKKARKYLADIDAHVVPVDSIAEPIQDCEEPIAKILRDETSEIVNRALQTLDFDDVYLLTSHYIEGQTYDDMKGYFGVSRERIRQLENDALRRFYLAMADILNDDA